MEIKTFIIGGPTASGKSDFAHDLARRTGGVIVNCDSVQVYQGIENISASPFAGREIMDEIDGVPYKLFSILQLTAQQNVAEYLELARDEFNAARVVGRPVIFVGGTGFYINALINGISPIPEISDDARNRARAMVRDYPDAAKQLLINADANFNSFDPQRMARALEVFLETGRPLSEWQNLPRQGRVVANATRIFINPPKDILDARIRARIPQMLSGGAMNEAKKIIECGWDTKRAIGADELVKFICGEIDKDTAIKNWESRTIHYAKRQRTWFRFQFPIDIEINHIPSAKDIDIVLSK
ncbi:MAG: tRNA (adenosine(37)-N6)-dimethylallyltransferase MiaA [Rickettsiales bacterium]|jgi:tRNA dimethylallyltransferase|nr:tRNA (adenosine(37)-N6)-dimethylallyltransferase MiaA [Rickettsiales bacterium]